MRPPFIPNWRIHHELNLLATSEFIRRQSPVLFILTYATPSLRPSLHGNPFQIPSKDPRRRSRASSCFYSSFLISSFFFSPLSFALISMPPPFPPKGNFQLRPISSIFSRIRNFSPEFSGGKKKTKKTRVIRADSSVASLIFARRDLNAIRVNHTRSRVREEARRRAPPRKELFS